jgi:hypothetical protein
MPNLSPLLFSELDAVQQARAAYLFADHLCGTDPNHYRYELDGDEISWRVRIVDAKPAKRGSIKQIAMYSCTAPNPTPAEIARAENALHDLAGFIYQRLKDSAYGQTQNMDQQNAGQTRSTADLVGTALHPRRDRALPTLSTP